MTEDPSPLDVMSRLKANDWTAWPRLVVLYAPLVLFWCRNARLRQADVSEVCGQIFTAAAAGVASYEPTPEFPSFRAWLRTVARNVIRVQTEKESGPPVGDDSAATYEIEEAVLLRGALSVLEPEFSPEVFNPFRIHLFEQKKVVEIAEQLKMTVERVHFAKASVLSRIRVEFGKLLD